MYHSSCTTATASTSTYIIYINYIILYYIILYYIILHTNCCYEILPLVDVGRHGGMDNVSVGISAQNKILKSQSPSILTNKVII